MKRKCKNIDITNIEFIEKAITDCLSGKKKTRQDIVSIMNKHNNSVHEIALEMQSELLNRKLNLKPIWYKRKYDDASRKVLANISVQALKDVDNSIARMQSIITFRKRMQSTHASLT